MAKIRTCQKFYACPGKCKTFETVAIQTKGLCPGQGQIWFVLELKGSNSKTNSTIWPQFELVRDLTPVMETSKFKENAIKLKALCPGQGQI